MSPVDLAALEVAPVEALLVARPFVLQEGFPHDWRADHPLVKEGVLVVLRTPARPPSQVQEPTLFVGDMPAWRLSWSPTDPYVVAVVPGAVDLESSPIYWAQVGQADQLDKATAGQVEEAARSLGLTAPAGAAWASARAVGGAGLQLKDSAELLCQSADLLRIWTPADAGRAEGWLLSCPAQR